MAERILVVSTLRFAPPLLERLRAVDPSLEVVQDTTLEPYLSQMEVLYTYHVMPQPAQAPRLRWIQIHSAGVDHLLGSGWLDHPEVKLTSTSGIHSGPVAEYVMASLLAWQRRVPLMIRSQDRGEWSRGRWDRYARPELRGATLGVAGYGSIGRQVACLARAFGMRILALKRHPRERRDRGYRGEVPGDPEGRIPERFYGHAEKLAFLSECDFLALTLPLNDETRGFLDDEALRAMKPSAYVVNVGRGGVIHEAALVRALEEGWIGGAGLDVFAEEPLPASSPLWRSEKVILSPHIAGCSLRYDERAADLFADNLRRYLDGQPLYNEIHPELAY